MLNSKIANLSDKEIRALQSLENALGNHICLLALKKNDTSYVLEAKLAPNTWERVDCVYPELENLCPFYDDERDARTAKSSIKTLLNGKMKGRLKKRPIRIRKVEYARNDSASYQSHRSCP